jgi:hypothetical protein
MTKRLLLPVILLLAFAAPAHADQWFTNASRINQSEGTVCERVVGGYAVPCDATNPLPTTNPALTPLSSQQTLVLTGSAQALTVPATATTVDFMPEGTAGTNNACLRYRDDGSNPTASAGFPLAPLQGVFGYKGSLSALRFINATGATCTITVNFYK